MQLDDQAAQRARTGLPKRSAATDRDEEPCGSRSFSSYTEQLSHFIQRGFRMRTVTSVDAQNRFGELLDSAQREPVTITRRGRPVAVVLSPEEVKDLLTVLKAVGGADLRVSVATLDKLAAS